MKPTSSPDISFVSDMASQGTTIYESVRVEGDFVLGNKVVHNHYPETPRPLNDFLITYNLELEYFVGRQWIKTALDKFLQENDRGYFILEAKAGLGKTAFLAHIVREQNYIHHFVGIPSNEMYVAVMNLSVQLIKRWEIPPFYKNQEILPPSQEPENLRSFLYQRLCEAATQRDRIAPESKIILVLDALDQTTPFLLLPSELPRGVYFIVSHRDTHSLKEVKAPYKKLLLQANEPNNQNDIVDYLKQTAHHPEIAKLLRQFDYTDEEFVEILQQKSQGLWIYLHYIIAELSRGSHKSFQLNELPEGLSAYYLSYWQKWRDEHSGDWTKIYLPLLSALAVLPEPRSLSYLCKQADIEQTVELDKLFDQDWRAFLNISISNEERTYQLYHSSLKEFLHGKINNFENFDTQERDVFEELIRATRHAHGRIVDRYLAEWGGLNNNLPQLQIAEKQNIDSGYGLRYVVFHLIGANRLEDLYQLLRCEWITKSKSGKRTSIKHQNVWYTVHLQQRNIDGYLRDIGLCREWIKQMVNTQITRNDIAPSLGIEIRLRLIVASISAIANNIGPKLLTAFVQSKTISLSDGFSYAMQMHNRLEKADALIALSEVPPETNADKQKQMQALPQSLSLMDEYVTKREYLIKNKKAGYLGVLYDPAPQIAHLIGKIARRGYANVALKLFRDIWAYPHVPHHLQARVLIELKPHIPLLEWEKKFAKLFEIAKENSNIKLFAALSYAKETYISQVWEDTAKKKLDEIEKKDDTGWDDTGWVDELLPYLPDTLLPRALEIVLVKRSNLNLLIRLSALLVRLFALLDSFMCYQIYENQRPLAMVAVLLAKAGLCKQAKAQVRQLTSIELQAPVLAAIAIHCDKKFLSRAVDASIQLPAWEAKEDLWENMAVELPNKLLKKIHDSLQVLSDKESQLQAMVSLAPHISVDKQRKLIERIYQSNLEEHVKDNLFSQLVPALPLELLDIVYRWAQKRGWFSDADKIFSSIVLRGAELDYPKAINEILPQIQDLALRALTAAQCSKYFDHDLEKQYFTLSEATKIAHEIEDPHKREEILNKISALNLYSTIPEEVIREHLARLDKWVLNEWVKVLPSIKNRQETVLSLLKLVFGQNFLLDLSQQILVATLHKIFELKEKPLPDEIEPLESDEYKILGKLGHYYPRKFLKGKIDATISRLNTEDSGQVPLILTQLSPYLTQDLVEYAIQLIEIGYGKWDGGSRVDADNRARALSGLILQLANLGYFEDALSKYQQVKGFWPGWQKTEAIMFLIPDLPQDLLPAVLPLIRQFENENKIRSMTQVAQRLAGSSQQSLLMEAWKCAADSKVANGWTDADAQARSVAMVVALMPPYNRDVYVQQGIKVMQDRIRAWTGCWESELQHCLGEMAKQFLEDGCPAEAKTVRQHIQSEEIINSVDYEFSKYKPLLLNSNDDSIPQKVLSLKMKIQNMKKLFRNSDKVKAFKNLAFWVTDLPYEELNLLLPYLLEAVKSIYYSSDQFDALQYLISKLAKDRPQTLTFVWANHLTEIMGDFFSGSEKVELIVLFAPGLKGLSGQVVQNEWINWLNMLNSFSFRREVQRSLNALASNIVHLPTSDLYSIWNQTIDFFEGQSSRSDFLEIISVLAPIISRIGGPETVDETVFSIREVSRWWP